MVVLALPVFPSSVQVHVHTCITWPQEILTDCFRVWVTVVTGGKAVMHHRWSSIHTRCCQKSLRPHIWETHWRLLDSLEENTQDSHQVRCRLFQWRHPELDTIILCVWLAIVCDQTCCSLLWHSISGCSNSGGNFSLCNNIWSSDKLLYS